ncbi:MAG: leucine-rich repeat domain-containing protein [Candidatus Berkiellales bacterium]
MAASGATKSKADQSGSLKTTLEYLLLRHFDLYRKHFNPMPNVNGPFSAADEKAINAKIEAINAEVLTPVLNKARREKAKKLSLQDLNLTCLPRALFLKPEYKELWSNIEELILFQNFIEELPDEIERCQSLKILNVSFNRIKKLPDTLSLLALESLECERNEIESLPLTFFRMQSLKNFSICYNKLKKLPSNVCLLRELDCLRIDHNQLEEVPDTLFKLPKLRFLGLINNQLKRFSFAEKNFPALEHLYLKNNLLQSVSLGSAPKLIWLGVDDNVEVKYVNNESKKTKAEVAKPKEVKPKESTVKVAKPKEVKPKESTGKVAKPEEVKPKESTVKVAKPKEVKPKESTGKVAKPEDAKLKVTKSIEKKAKEEKPKKAKPKEEPSDESSISIDDEGIFWLFKQMGFCKKPKNEDKNPKAKASSDPVKKRKREEAESDDTPRPLVSDEAARPTKRRRTGVQ